MKITQEERDLLNDIYVSDELSKAKVEKILRYLIRYVADTEKKEFLLFLVNNNMYRISHISRFLEIVERGEYVHEIIYQAIDCFFEWDFVEKELLHSPSTPSAYKNIQMSLLTYEFDSNSVELVRPSNYNIEDIISFLTYKLKENGIIHNS